MQSHSNKAAPHDHKPDAQTNGKENSMLSCTATGGELWSMVSKRGTITMQSTNDMGKTGYSHLEEWS